MQRTAFTCPLCGRECKTEGHVRSHIHEDHRKSEVIEAYLAG